MTKNNKIKEAVMISFGVILTAIGFYFFYDPQNLVTGGVGGLSTIFRRVLEEYTSLSEVKVNVLRSVFHYSANIILLVIGALVLGKDFFFRTIFGTLFLSTIIMILTLLKVPQDLVLSKFSNSNQFFIASILGSIFTGVGIGLVFKYNATTGGTDVLQKILYHNLKVPYSVAVYVVDGLVVALGIFVTGIEPAFYALIAVFIVGFIVDRIVLAGQAGYTLFIVTNEYQKIKEAIYSDINRGLTKVSVVGGYSEHERDMIICTISKDQLFDLKAIIEEIDPHAFTFITRTIESVGKGFSKE